jgi:hypothetical protein
MRRGIVVALLGSAVALGIAPAVAAAEGGPATQEPAPTQGRTATSYADCVSQRNMNQALLDDAKKELERLIALRAEKEREARPYLVTQGKLLLLVQRLDQGFETFANVKQGKLKENDYADYLDPSFTPVLQWLRANAAKYDTEAALKEALKASAANALNTYNTVYLPQLKEINEAIERAQGMVNFYGVLASANCEQELPSLPADVG